MCIRDRNRPVPRSRTYAWASATWKYMPCRVSAPSATRWATHGYDIRWSSCWTTLTSASRSTSSATGRSASATSPRPSRPIRCIRARLGRPCRSQRASGVCAPGSWSAPSSACIAPHPECPQTVSEPTFNTSTAYSMAAPTESHAASVPGGGIRLPTLRTVNRSPGPLAVIMLVTSRESAQVRKSWVGRCPSCASRASSSRTSGAVLRWNALTPTSS